MHTKGTGRDEYSIEEEAERDITLEPETQSVPADAESKIDDKYLLPGAILLAGLAIAGAILFVGSRSGVGSTSSSSSGSGAPSAPQGQTVDIKDVKLAGEPFIGKAAAPVALVEWADYQCPFCKRFEQDSLPQIVKTYVDTGKVKIVFKDFAFLGEDSITAGKYGRAIWKLYPDKYLEWRNAMYAAQDAEGDQGFGDAASIDTLNAGIAGIDAAKVAADVKANSAAYQAQLDANKTEAGTFGIGATPSFIVGTEKISGAYPYSTFQAAIDKVLSKK